MPIRAFICSAILLAGIALFILATSSSSPQTPSQEESSESLSLSKTSSITRVPGPKAESAPPHSVTQKVRPEVLNLQTLAHGNLAEKSVPLRRAKLVGSERLEEHRLGRYVNDHGESVVFNPQALLVKLKGRKGVFAVRTPPGEEIAAMKILNARADVEYAELDILLERQFTPNDFQVQQQWHHEVVDTFSAWDLGFGSSQVTIAVVDTPFQMDHPDLAGNTQAGWDLVEEKVIESAPGIVHSTMTAGMAAAVVHNATGVAGIANVSILPLNITGFSSEMYQAILWAADHGVRVVNISWSGANIRVLNDAGRILAEEARGILCMSGINENRFLDYPDHPYIQAVSMTNSNDVMNSSFGKHIDFAAPGEKIFSTSTLSTYGTESGTSFATPVFAGAAALMMSFRPDLEPSQILDVLRITAVDLGAPGRDDYYGWGRIDVGTAVRAILPRILSLDRSSNPWTLTTEPIQNVRADLIMKESLTSRWHRVGGVNIRQSSGRLEFSFPPPESSMGYFRLFFTRQNP